MENQRSLAYQLATIVDLHELEDITGGGSKAGPIVIPTVQITGGPIFPDGRRDNNGD
jgi:hypothetical protein